LSVENEAVLYDLAAIFATLRLILFEHQVSRRSRKLSDDAGIAFDLSNRQ
jgi:hypothetical protein